MRYRMPGRLGLERLEQRHMLSATVFEHNDIGYFLNQSDPGFSRYDIQNEQWLSPIDLTDATGLPTAAHVDDDGIYVAYGATVYRYQLDGTGQTHVINAQYDVQRIHTDGNLLFVNHTAGHYTRVISIDKNNNTVIDTIDDYLDTIYGSSISTSENRIFGRTRGSSPSDITYVSYDDQGHFLSNPDSPYHGDYPGATEAWVFDDGARVVDSSGTIYSTSLTYLNSFQSGVTDIDFVGGEIPIVLHGGEVTAYSMGILPTGSKTLAVPATDIFVNDKSVIAFSGSPGSYSVEIVPLTELSAPEPGEPLDPTGLPYTPDEIALATDGTVLLFSKSHQSIFQWDPVRQEYGETIPLVGSPLHMTYAEMDNSVFLAYDSGLIRKIDLDLDEKVEVPFMTLPSRPHGLSAAGNFLFSADPSGAWESHYTISFEGQIVDSKEWSHASAEYIWNNNTRRMYYFTQWSPRDLEYVEIGATGQFGIEREAPQHSSAGFTYPIRVSPDGGTVILGSGVIHDGSTLERLTQSLGTTVTDIAWLGSDTYTIRDVGGTAQLQAWAGVNWGQTDVAQVPGTVHSLTTVSEDRMLAITIDGQGVPAFSIIDGDLDVVTRPAPVAIAGADVRVDIGSSTTLDGSASYDPDESPSPLTYSWTLAAGPGAGTFGTPDQPVTTFSATAPGLYEVALTVNDGEYSTTDIVEVTYRINEEPIADASLSETSGIAGRNPIALSAAGSSDPNGDPITFLWEVVAAPESSQWTLGSSDSAVASLAAADPGDYTLRLSVSDGALTGTTTIVVTFVENQAPTADPSLSETTAVAGRHSARLDGTASTDPEGDSLTYHWDVVSAPAGSNPTIQDASAGVTTFFSDTAGSYLVSLTVDDGLKSATESFLIDVAVNQSPIADASLTQTVVIAGPGFAVLDGTLSSDPDDTVLSYSWQVVASSNGTLPSISSRHSAVAYLAATLPGVYAIELAVADGATSDKDYVIVEVTGNQAPVADASLSDRVVSAGVLPRLDATRSHDPDGDDVSYSWEVVASSNGTLPIVSAPNQAITQLETASLGFYTVRLTVDDGTDLDTDFVIVIVRENTSPARDGDYDGDQNVDGNDFLMWQRAYGTAGGSMADGTHDGIVDHEDLAMWEDNYTSSAATVLPGIAGDMDSDQDVDGIDFLAWQRDLDATHHAYDLDAWQGNYGATNAITAIRIVPTAEPITSASIAEIVDLAIAVELTETRTTELSLDTPEEPIFLEPFARNRADSLYAPPYRSTDVEAEPSTSESPREDEFGNVWLSEELLDRVFG